MKRTTFAILAALAVLIAPAAARADVFSVTADLPVAYSFDDGGSADSVSGFKAGVSLPFLIGFGLENYTVTDKDDSGSEASVDFTFLDLFVNLPVPFVNIVLGVGAGAVTGDLKDSPAKLENTTATQYFVSLGIPIAAVFDVHVGYHWVQAKADITVDGDKIDQAKLDGNMTSVGIKVGF